MQSFPENRCSTFRCEINSERISWKFFAQNPVTDSAWCLGSAPKVLESNQAPVPLRMLKWLTASSQQNAISTYQHIFSHRERSDWLKACNWGLGHSGQKRKGSHHACQVNASTKVKSCEALSENIIYLCLLCGLPSWLTMVYTWLYMSIYYTMHIVRLPTKNARELYLESCLAQCGSMPREWTAADCKAWCHLQSFNSYQFTFLSLSSSCCTPRGGNWEDNDIVTICYNGLVILCHSPLASIGHKNHRKQVCIDTYWPPLQEGGSKMLKVQPKCHEHNHEGPQYLVHRRDICATSHAVAWNMQQGTWPRGSVTKTLPALTLALAPPHCRPTMLSLPNISWQKKSEWARTSHFHAQND